MQIHYFLNILFVQKKKNKNLIVVNQYYGADILMEYVIKGNSAVLKCSIPSFVADFVRVESWIDEENNILKPSDNYGWHKSLYKIDNTLWIK